MTGRDMDGAVGAPGRRFMLTACCCAMLADLYFTAVGGNLADGRSWIPLIPYILLCGALPFRPKTAGLLLIVYWWILVWLPTGSASDLLFSSCLVWGVLSFLLSPWMTLLAQSCNVLLLSLTVLRDTSEPRAVIAVLVMQIAATVAGYALRRHRLDDTAREQRLRLRTTQERIAILERNMRLARRLHDDLTNNLASIGMLCEAHLLSCSDPDERLLLTSIRDKTRESVSCAHEVIDILRGQTGPIPPPVRDRAGGGRQSAAWSRPGRPNCAGMASRVPPASPSIRMPCSQWRWRTRSSRCSPRCIPTSGPMPRRPTGDSPLSSPSAMTESVWCR